jgi:hypothetical protein
MVQFLMYDKAMKGKITVEDTLELLYVRVGRYNLDNEIYSIFGSDEKTVTIRNTTIGRRTGEGDKFQGVPRQDAPKGLQQTQANGCRTQDSQTTSRGEMKVFLRYNMLSFFLQKWIL